MTAKSQGIRAVFSRLARSRVRPDDSDPPVLGAAGRHLAPDLVDYELLLVRPFDRFPIHPKDRAADRVEVAWTVLAHGADGIAAARQPGRVVNPGRVDLHGSRVLPADRAIDRRWRHVRSERVRKEGGDVDRDKWGAAGVTEVVADAADVAGRAEVKAGPVDAGLGGPEPPTRSRRRRHDRGWCACGRRNARYRDGWCRACGERNYGDCEEDPYTHSHSLPCKEKDPVFRRGLVQSAFGALVRRTGYARPTAAPARSRSCSRPACRRGAGTARVPRHRSCCR